VGIAANGCQKGAKTVSTKSVGPIGVGNCLKSLKNKQMKTLLKMLLLAVAIIAGISESKAQGYSGAIGLRGGAFSGLSGKFALQEGRYLEANLGLFQWNNGFSLTGIYEIMHPIAGSHFYWEYGLGAHLASYNSGIRD